MIDVKRRRYLELDLVTVSDVLENVFTDAELVFTLFVPGLMQRFWLCRSRTPQIGTIKRTASAVIALRPLRHVWHV